jgi:hypothetical protein
VIAAGLVAFAIENIGVATSTWRGEFGFLIAGASSPLWMKPPHFAQDGVLRNIRPAQDVGL